VGLVDVADDWGYAYHSEDFGQTLGSYGVGEGVYLVLPLFGPSSIRDGIGLGVDIFLDPLTYVATEYDLETEFLSRPLAEGIDKRSRNIETLEDLQRDSIDFYARVRSLYRQSRRNDIENDKAEPRPLPGLSSIDFEYELDDEQVGSSD
ncbi:MAG: MlaA family lipoprotein, partial [Kiloniellaceae bacterium]